MTFATTLENFFTTTETYVQNVITQFKQVGTVVETEVDAALGWVVNNIPTIVADIESVVGFAAAVGATTNPTVAAAVTAAQEAIVALNAVAAAKNGGATDIQTLLAGYSAIKSAQAGSASALAAAVAPVTTASVAAS